MMTKGAQNAREQNNLLGLLLRGETSLLCKSKLGNRERKGETMIRFAQGLSPNSNSTPSHTHGLAKSSPDEDEPTSNLEMKKSSFVGGWGCDKTNKNENMHKVLGQKIKPTPSRVKVKRLT